jgi:hypothetical protein
VKLLAEWWSSIWPNLASSVLTFTSGLAWARRKLLVEFEKREAAYLLRHAETTGLVRAVHDRLDALDAHSLQADHPWKTPTPTRKATDDNLRP